MLENSHVFLSMLQKLLQEWFRVNIYNFSNFNQLHFKCITYNKTMQNVLELLLSTWSVLVFHIKYIFLASYFFSTETCYSLSAGVRSG